MQNEKIHLERIKRFIARIKEAVHTDKTELEALYISDEHPIPLQDTNTRPWTNIKKGQVWGKAWGSAWFLVKGSVPTQMQGKNIGLWFDCDGEACLFKDGTPWQGLTPKVDWYHNAAKYFVPISSSANANETFEILIEAAANDLFGSGKEEYSLRECSLVCLDETLYQFALDLELLFDLANSLPAGSVHRAKIIYGLNRVCNLYSEGKGLTQCIKITRDLLIKPANASALTAYSVGHAHLDLAWLWPIRESKRKGGRTFANALRLLEQYPDYIFGASQAQLYQWMKEQYPGLYSQVKAAVRQGRWEVQGASWVEFDTNLTSGESIIHQFIYGRRFFKEEFGIVPDHLWLPDCFGFSANLPQLMQGCGVDYFITQKLSWNETNVFPHHLFIWKGIDGSSVRAHQLPTNDYNFSNNPSAFHNTDARFAQAELSEAYLNLYGIGDGGGGPTRNHIEYGLRLQNLEDCPKFRFAQAREFLDYYGSLDATTLPTMYGELYLEFHRGTYTTQARMKQQNVQSEQYLKTAEALSALSSIIASDTGKTDYPPELRKIWEDTLLLQFHDILPGSSIGKVYEDANALCEHNHHLLRSFIRDQVQSITTDSGTSEQSLMLFNPAGTAKLDWITVPVEQSNVIPRSDNAEIRDYYRSETDWHILVKVPALSFAHIVFNPASTHTPARIGKHSLDESPALENEYLKVQIAANGSIVSVYDKELQRELLAGPSNLLQLWEDEPNNWGAWDINHFYRETIPLAPENVHGENEQFFLTPANGVVQFLQLSRSTIRQEIELPPGERYLTIKHEIDWQERHKMLRASFQPDIQCETATCGVQMGSVQRPTVPHNAWEAARFEFPAQGYVDLSDAAHGCALICSTKFGYSLNSNKMEIALLRSPADVDPQADIGDKNHSYALYFHNQPFAQAKVPELTLALATDFCVAAGRMPLLNPDASLFSLESGKLIINCLKPAEDGKGIILRLFEPLGCRTSDRLFSAFAIQSIQKCNMLEEPLFTLDSGGVILAEPFEIITLRLKVQQ